MLRVGLRWVMISLAAFAAAGCGAEAPAPQQDAGAAKRPDVSSAVQDVAKAVREAAQDGTQLRDRLTGLLENLTETLRGIQDSETAQAALARLKESELSLDELARAAEKLPAAARPLVAAAAKRGSAKIKTLIEQAEQHEQVPDSVKPVLDAILEKLAAFQTAP